MTDPETSPLPPKLPLFLRILHVVIIVNFVVNIAYASYQVFGVLAPEGSAGLPLFGAAQSLDFEHMVTRRLYASEAWISISGLAIYLAITEYLPRLLRPRA